MNKLECPSDSSNTKSPAPVPRITTTTAATQAVSSLVVTTAQIDAWRTEADAGGLQEWERPFFLAQRIQGRVGALEAGASAFERSRWRSSQMRMTRWATS